MYHEDVSRLLGQCSQLAKRRLLHLMQHYAFTPAQAHAMLFLIHNAHRDETTQQALERHLKIRPSTVNGVVARLEEKGLITRAPGKSDGRSKQLILTEKGLQFEAAFNEGIRQSDAVILHGFSPEERLSLFDFLLRIIHNLEEETDPC